MIPPSFYISVKKSPPLISQNPKGADRQNATLCQFMKQFMKRTAMTVIIESNSNLHESTKQLPTAKQNGAES